MTALEEASAVRRAAGLFCLEQRRVLAVRGGDRVRWLDGMLSNDVRSLGPERSGCYATLLTRTGRIVTDLHVLWRPDELWLDLDAAAMGPARAHLEKFIIADDVELEDCGEALIRLGLEGPAATKVLEAASLDPKVTLEPHDAREVRLAGHVVQLAAWGWSGESAFQITVPGNLEKVPGTRGNAPRSRENGLVEALVRAGRRLGLVEAGLEALEILRIEAGVPRFGAELDESVLPDEARLEAAVSTTKGCYTGQEVVARLRSQGQVSHLLVGLKSEGKSPLPIGSEVTLEGSRIGEVTSACLSPSAGAIALAFLRRPHHEPGTEVFSAGQSARVAALPFVSPAPDGA